MVCSKVQQNSQIHFCHCENLPSSQKSRKQVVKIMPKYVKVLPNTRPINPQINFAKDLTKSPKCWCRLHGRSVYKNNEWVQASKQEERGRLETILSFVRLASDSNLSPGILMSQPWMFSSYLPTLLLLLNNNTKVFSSSKARTFRWHLSLISVKIGQNFLISHITTLV